MATVYMMIGIPGSGKSTYVGEKLERAFTRIISPDEIRKELYGDISIQGDGEKVFKIVDERLRYCAIHEINVIYDATNTTKHRPKTVLKLREMGFDKVIGVYMNTPFGVCVERNKQRKDRSKPVPDDVMLKMFVNMKNTEYELFSDGFDEIRIINRLK